jgi:DNA-binding NarL/FixJ family response regulator
MLSRQVRRHLHSSVEVAWLPARPERPFMIRVLVVDDHDFFRQCLVDLVNTGDGLEAVGECRDGTEVTAAVRELGPQVVLMDVRMVAMSGLEAAAALQRDGASTRVIMLTSDTAETTRAAARANGAAGYLLKGSDADRVVEAIHRVAAGGTAWPEDLEPYVAT